MRASRGRPNAGAFETNWDAIYQEGNNELNLAPPRAMTEYEVAPLCLPPETVSFAHPQTTFSLAHPQTAFLRPSPLEKRTLLDL